MTKSNESRGGMTLEEVGRVLDVTCERVRQIEAKALKKLRKRCVAAGLYPDGCEPVEAPPERDPDLPEGW